MSKKHKKHHKDDEDELDEEFYSNFWPTALAGVSIWMFMFVLLLAVAK